VPRNRASI